MEIDFIFQLLVGCWHGGDQASAGMERCCGPHTLTSADPFAPMAWLPVPLRADGVADRDQESMALPLKRRRENSWAIAFSFSVGSR